MLKLVCAALDPAFHCQQTTLYAVYAKHKKNTTANFMGINLTSTQLIRYALGASLLRLTCMGIEILEYREPQRSRTVLEIEA